MATSKPQNRKPTPQTRPAQRPAQPTRPTTAVATRPKSEMSTDVSKLLDRHAGKGVSHAQEDNIVPLIYLLQANSKVCLRGSERFVEGAKGGDIWLRNAAPPDCFVDGEQGVLFQPCYFSKCWIEWMPERGGFVQRHATRPEAAELQEYEDDNGNPRKGWRMPNENHVVETREYSGFVVDEDGSNPRPYTVPLSGTGHSVGKSWMTSMRDKKLPSGEPAPLFAALWRLRTKLRSKNENSWYQYEIQEERDITTVEEVNRAVSLHDAFVGGTKVSAAMDDIEGAVEETADNGET